MKLIPTRDVIEMILPFVIVFAIFFLGYQTLRPFLPAMLWALTLGVSLAPLHARLRARLWGRAGLATTVVTILMLLLLLLPMIGLSRAIIAFIPDVLKWIDGLSLPTELENAGLYRRDKLTDQEPSILWARLKSDVAIIEGYFGTELKPFASWLLQEGRQVGGFVLEFALGIVLAAILLQKQDRVGPALERLFLRIGGETGSHMAAHAAVTIRSTFLAVILAAAAQSAVASVAYIASGVPHWAILTALTFLLAMFQVGPVLIWVPIAVWLALGGQPGMAVFVCIWGLVAVGLTDNLVRTVLVTKASEIPGILAFLGAIGGLLAWGIVGVFLGPVIVAVCYKMVLVWGGDRAEDSIESAEGV